MVELRWLEKETGRQLQNEWGYFYYETIQVLQYRNVTTTLVKVHDGDKVIEVPKQSFTEWIDVPVVQQKIDNL